MLTEPRTKYMRCSDCGALVPCTPTEPESIRPPARGYALIVAPHNTVFLCCECLDAELDARMAEPEDEDAGGLNPPNRMESTMSLDRIVAKQAAYYGTTPEADGSMTEHEMLFRARLKSFLKGCEAIYTKHMDKEYPANLREGFGFSFGKKFVKVYKTREGKPASTHCFIDISTGDVLKAVSWNVPAKGARGNIFAEDNGLSRMGPWGA